jgi:hypothetical protein
LVIDAVYLQDSIRNDVSVLLFLTCMLTETHNNLNVND